MTCGQRTCSWKGSPHQQEHNHRAGQPLEAATSTRLEKIDYPPNNATRVRVGGCYGGRSCGEQIVVLPKLLSRDGQSRRLQMGSPAVVGVGITDFGRFPQRSLKDLCAEAVTAAVSDAGIDVADIGLAAVSNS